MRNLVEPILWPSVAQTWATLSQQKLDWAFRAYNHFFDSLSEETREHFAKGDAKGEAYVVVFGKTQVGKTTLLLDLMGLSGVSLARVSCVLRGKRESGKSATATAMEYRYSSDAQWWLHDGVEKRAFHNDDGMTTALCEIRAQMSKRSLKSDDPMIVWIPSDCFANDTNTSPRVRMLDLPGDNPADPIERAHVQTMAKKYVPHADLILLVGRGDDLSFLRPDALELPSIEDWQIVPSRFRIVTTYSFTAQSVRDLTRQQQKPLSAEFFRQRLLDQIRTFGLELGEDASRTDRFFPLEFGSSWEKAAERESHLVEALQPVISDLKKKLHTDIAESATEIARLRNAVDVHIVADKVKQTREAQFYKELTSIQYLKDQVLAEWREAKQLAKKAQNAYEDVQKLMDLLSKEQLRPHVERMTTLDICDELIKVDRIDTDVSDFKCLIRTFSESLKTKFSKIEPIASIPEKIRKFFKSIDPGLDLYVTQVDELVIKEFSSLRRKLNDYWIDMYTSRSSDNFLSDQNGMRRDMKDSANAVSKLAFKLWWDAIEKRHIELSKDIREKISSKNSFSQVENERRTILIGMDNEIKKINDAKEIFVRKNDADRSQSHKFIAQLEREYREELMERRNRVRRLNSPVHALLELIGAFQVIEQYKQLNIGTK